ncbi:hypothetical protein ESCNG_20185 [Neisseria gonorrhoeae]|nr:hypothetical protein ESCNG_20185 [Neisseria gonorrhoeae]
MAQIVGHPDLNVQKAVVDGADVEVDAFAAALCRRVGKAGHAVDADISAAHVVLRSSLKWNQYITSVWRQAFSGVKN